MFSYVVDYIDLLLPIIFCSPQKEKKKKKTLAIGLNIWLSPLLSSQCY